MGLRVVVRPRAEMGADPALSECTYEFEQERVLVGRAPASDVRLPGLGVGARHLSLRVESGRHVVIDHGSVNGSRLNGTQLVPERPRAVRDGDQLELGGYVLDLRLGAVVTQATSRERTLSLARRLLEAELSGAPPTCRFVVLNGAHAGREHPLPPPPATLRIGRGTSCQVVLDDADASREHAEVHVDLDGVLVRDLGSKNGIEVNGRKVAERRLKDRDEVLVGATMLAFEDPSEAALAARASEPEVATPREPEPPPAAEPGEEPPPAEALELAAPLSTRSEPTEPMRRALRDPSTAPGSSFRGPELFVLAVALVVLVLSVVGLVVLLGE